jgi:5-methylcytosine-specific restriction protein A
VKLCTVCGVVTSRSGSRCLVHARQSNRSRHNALYSTREWQRLSARVLRAWRGQHGNWCPGYQRDAHPASDLTVDHVVPLSAGGAPLDITNCAVLCRSCNSTKGASEADRGYPHADSARLEDQRHRGLGMIAATGDAGDGLLLSVAGDVTIASEALRIFADDLTDESAARLRALVDAPDGYEWGGIA